MAELSPMMQQYLEIKAQTPDAILFFRLGDFYEMFFEDAKLASEELELTLTGRDCGQEERAPMCGIPYHSCESYIARLIEKGYRVAICEQLEDPATTKGLVKRGIVNIISPGTVIDDSMLDEAKNNYLCSLYYTDGEGGLCFADASTGLVHLTRFSGDDTDQRIIGELGRFSPREIITTDVLKNHPSVKSFIENRIHCRITERTHAQFDTEKTRETIQKHFNVSDCAEIGVPDTTAAVALGAALIYLYETKKNGLETIREVDYYSDSEYMRLDISAMHNLELVSNMRNGDKRGTLLWVLDKTKTALGRRRILGMLEQPLTNINLINARLNAVEELTVSSVKRGEIRECLSGIRDLERIMSRVVFGTVNPKDLLTLADSVAKLPDVCEQLKTAETKLLKSILKDMDLLEDIGDAIHNTLCDEPAALIREGGIIREGFSAELDELRFDFSDGKNVISRIESTEREKTGIKNLKVKYNKVFGYYIEVPNSFRGEVPPQYIRKQTLTNCERYITEELKNLEIRVLGARERANRLEYDLFVNLRTLVANAQQRVLKTADAIARLDAIASLAEVAMRNNYVRPNLNFEGKLVIKDGRHPVVELINSQPFIPNDTFLDTDENRCAIITGPNMAGKSTFMRQTALITVMAQMGSFVPASYADISVCDAVYTRVGASDDLASGRSTFMVEMSEVAYILKNATKNSLLILDEIGRGTSTYDGMSIARAVLEYCADRKKLGAKTFFATHYHELTALEGQVKGIRNYNIAAKKRGDDIIFLRKIVKGSADESYGIEVAKLSGIPNIVINRAKSILKELENGTAGAEIEKAQYEEPQVSLSQPGADALLEELSLIDVNSMTPIEALSVLSEFSDRAKKSI